MSNMDPGKQNPGLKNRAISTGAPGPGRVLLGWVAAGQLLVLHSGETCIS
jgi:hypothetical protein